MMLGQVAQAAAGVTAETTLFWVFAVLALGSAIAVISLRNIVHGALMLVLNFLAVAGLFLNLSSPFLSIIQVLVYGGAIMVLFLFVIMLLGVDNDDLLSSSVRGRVMAVVGGALLAGALLFAFVGPYTSAASVCADDAPPPAAGQMSCAGLEYDEDDGAGAAFLGRSMFTTYTYAFELSALLLTVATIGAVILARRRDLEPEDEDLADRDERGPDDAPDDAARILAGDGIDDPQEHAGVGGSPAASGSQTPADDRPSPEREG